MIYTTQHLDECKIRKKAMDGDKTPWTCTYKTCTTHLWVCSYHKTSNASAMSKAKAELRKSGLTLFHPAVFKTPSKQRGVIRKPSTVPAGRTTANNQTEKTPEDSVKTSSNENAIMSNEKGKLRKFITNARKRGLDVVPEPKGRPIFMFFAAKGRNKPVQVFFDSGCSDAVMREGIPGVEWRGIVTRKGPFGMGGVGGLSSTTKDEWMVLVPRADGKMQSVRGYSMN